MQHPVSYLLESPRRPSAVPVMESHTPSPDGQGHLATEISRLKAAALTAVLREILIETAGKMKSDTAPHKMALSA
jgi:hypothetical protein